MGKKNKNQNKSGFNKNTDRINYDEEMGRKTIGNLINGLDDNVDEQVQEKPVVRAVRLNANKANREKISTDFYDEDRAANNGTDIVTGFRESEDEPEMSMESADFIDDSPQDEEDLADVVRTRRPNILKDDLDEEHDARERYRKQFLEGYTDHERKKLELDSTAIYETKRKSADNSLSDRHSNRDSEEERELPPKRRPKESLRKSREDAQNTEQRPTRRKPASEDEVTLIAKRNERKERAPVATAQPSYSAPIFKIFAGLILILIIVIVTLIISLNSANNQVAYLEYAAAQFDADVEELERLRPENVGLRTRNDDLVDDVNRLTSQIEDLERQLLVQGTDTSAVPGAPGDVATTPDGATEHVVQDGQTLYSISIIYFGHGRGADAIRLASGLADTNIRVGDRLTIPPTY